MKKAMLIMTSSFLFTLLNFDTHAQSGYRPALQKGSVLISGDLALSFGNAKMKSSGQFGSFTSEAKYNSFTFSPKAGFFIANGFALGLALDLTSTTYKDDEDDSKSTLTQFTIGPSVKYYAPGGFFVQGNITFGKSKEKYTDGTNSDSDDSKISKWQLGIGYAIFLNDFVSLEPGIMYRSSISKSKTDFAEYKNTLGEFVLGAGLNIFLHKKSE